MKKFKQSDCGYRGWYIGQWENAVFKTDLFEVGHGFNAKGELSAKHFHKIATEVNLVTSGKVLVNGELIQTGEGFVFEPGETCECVYLEDTYTLVIKTPGVPGDKYYV